jgi:hypothetical protein
MVNYIVEGSQTFLDVVLMGCGTLEGAMAIAAANGLSITDDVTIGQIVGIPDGIPADYAVLNYYAINGIVVGTGNALLAEGDYLIDELDGAIIDESGEAILTGF